MPSTPASTVFLPTVPMRKVARWMANHVYNKAGMDIGATTTGAETNSGSGIIYSIDGVHKTPKTDGSEPTPVPFTAGHTSLAASQKCLVAFTVNAAGDFTSYQSSIVAASADDPEWPAIPITQACFGGVKIETSSSGTFVFGTEDLNDAQVTDTYYDFNGLPNTGPSAVSLTVTGS